MTTHALVRLAPLDLIRSETVPDDRRREIARRRQGRRQAVGDAVGLAACGSVTGLFALGYLFGAYLMWLSHHHAWCVLASIAGSALAAVTGLMAWKFPQAVLAYRQLPVTERLRLEAESEQALADAAFRLNGHVADWNASADLAKEQQVDPRFIRGLLASRAEIAARLDAFGDRLTRFRLAIKDS